jgi:hypothetical protein
MVDLFEVQPIAPESTLPRVDAPPSLLGERSAHGGGAAPAVVLAEAREREIVLRMLDPGVATVSEARRE